MSELLMSEVPLYQIGARKWSSKARDLGAAHGHFQTECNACIRLGIQVDSHQA